MDHVVYLDYKAKELENLSTGVKTMIIRGAMGRKLPYDRVHASDVLYFIENNGDGLIKGRAVVERVYNSPVLTKEESVHIVDEHSRELCLNPGLYKRFAGKRYLVLITVTRFESLTPFGIDRSAYANMDDWLPVGNIEEVKVSDGKPLR